MATLRLGRRHMEVLHQIVKDHMVSEIETDAKDGEMVARQILAEIRKCLRPYVANAPSLKGGAS